MGGFDGTAWVRCVEATADQVIAEHLTLDPRTVDGPVRESDGRSIWLNPKTPHLTHPEILAQEERIITFALAAQHREPQPSPTVDIGGLDVLQAGAARAVAGHDELVLVVGPAGTGKTTMLARATLDLHHQQRPMVGIAPTAKAAHVLALETGMWTDTVAKLLYEWDRATGPRQQYRLPAGATLVLDESGMVGTSSLDRLVGLAQSQQWRLVLVGDPRQLQAVGRGGMFDELCRPGRTHELATIHRFIQQWEQTATLQLRNAHPAALDAYLDHNRVAAGDLDDHLDHIADAWITHHAADRTVAVTAETNAYVDLLNDAIQARRHETGNLDRRVAVPVAGDETAGPGDVIVTRRNDRTLVDEAGETLRNREQWHVERTHRDGSLTVSRMSGHGTVTLPADYVREHVRLGYAATAHGHQGDTVDASYTLVSTTTSHRGLYVGATRGRNENHLLVVTETPDLAEAHDLLEFVLTNDRVDAPALVQRRRLADEARTAQPSLTDQLAKANARVEAAARRHRPFDERVQQAESRVEVAERSLAQVRGAKEAARPWARHQYRSPIGAAEADLRDARDICAQATDAARQTRSDLDETRQHLHSVDEALSADRMIRRLDDLQRRAIEPHGLGLGR